MDKRLPHGGGIVLAMGICLPFWLGVAGCASALKTPCEFSVKVRVLNPDDTDNECRVKGVVFSDWGGSIPDSRWIRGCAPVGEIITNGTELNAGHEMAHQIDRHCR